MTITGFHSRWVPVPDGVRELEGGLPQGFRASGVAAGIKPSGGHDVGLRERVVPARPRRTVVGDAVVVTTGRIRGSHRTDGDRGRGVPR